MVERTRRLVLVFLVLAGIGTTALLNQLQQPVPAPAPEYVPEVQGDTSRATDVLATLPIKGRAPKTDYAREQFGAGWAEVDGCDMRNTILARDLTGEILDDDGCIVLTGTLNDPYTGKEITFQRGRITSSEIQIDHVVALSDAWQKGAQNLDVADRATFANDPLNLLAVDGPTNQKKGDADASSWLPPNKAYRCRYVARQIAVKQSYNLWITQAEHDAMKRVLATCPTQILPLLTFLDDSHEQPIE